MDGRLQCRPLALALPLLLASMPSITAAAPQFSQELAYWTYAIASASYCNDSSLQQWSCVPCRRSNSSVSEVSIFHNHSTDGRAILGLFRQPSGDERIVFSVRGTESLENWIEDLKAFKTDRSLDPQSCPGCKVHSGFVDVWDSLTPQFLPALAKLRARYPSAPITVTGHSLGAAVAILAAYVLEQMLKVRVDALFTYGSPTRSLPTRTRSATAAPGD